MAGKILARTAHFKRAEFSERAPSMQEASIPTRQAKRMAPRIQPLRLLAVGACLLFAQFLPSASGSELLVYYANETCLEGDAAENHRQFEQWLAALPTEKATNALKHLRRDREEFPAVVARETIALASAPVHVVVFQNALACQGVFLERTSGATSGFVRAAFPELLTSSDPVYRANPLSCAAGLDAALRAVHRLAQQRGIERLGFIIKSHGSAEMALTPRLTLWHTEVRAEELSSLLDRSTPDPGIAKRGVSGTELTERLNAFQKVWGRPVQFVFVETCRANAPALRLGLDRGFQRIFAGASQKMDYHTLDYPAMLAAIAAAGSDDFLAGFARELKRHPRLIEHRLIPWPQRLAANWVYFVPLALVLAWCAAVRLKRTKGFGRDGLSPRPA